MSAAEVLSQEQYISSLHQTKMQTWILNSNLVFLVVVSISLYRLIFTINPLSWRRPTG